MGEHGPMASEDDLRRLALSLPATTEKPSYGTPGFRVKDKLFARVREEDVAVLWCADLGEKAGLLASDPAVFFTTPHYDGHPTVLVRLSAIDEDELAEVVTDAWRVRAPKKLREEFERLHPAPEG
jgi:hypothetical protein